MSFSIRWRFIANAEYWYKLFWLAFAKSEVIGSNSQRQHVRRQHTSCRAVGDRDGKELTGRFVRCAESRGTSKPKANVLFENFNQMNTTKTRFYGQLIT